MGEVIWDSAVEAASSAFVVCILGGVAFSIAGAFAGGMIPSRPPFFAGRHQPEIAHSSSVGDWLHSLKGHAFAFLFAVFFAHSLWIGFRRFDERGAGKRLVFILSKLREDWFGLIVGNAIGAWVGAVILVWASGFSMTQMIWHRSIVMIFSCVQSLAVSVLGHREWSRVEDLISWYNTNQIKLNFWFLYFAGCAMILDFPISKSWSVGCGGAGSNAGRTGFKSQLKVLRDGRLLGGVHQSGRARHERAFGCPPRRFCQGVEGRGRGPFHLSGPEAEAH
ncbi:MAG TPA: hypothetical protein VGO67_14815 [Verrucomicrobiae bacterium]